METDLSPLLANLLLPSPIDLQLERRMIDLQNRRVTLAVTVVQAAPACPRCHTPSARVHSGYMRTVADLPWPPPTVSLQLQVRKCFCPNPACSQRIFTARLPTVVAPWARRTPRRTSQQRGIGLALGGAASERLRGALDCVASRDTFLPLVRTTPTADGPPPRGLGVDDWALRKGQS
jgi:hypothetical protein